MIKIISLLVLLTLAFFTAGCFRKKKVNYLDERKIQIHELQKDVQENLNQQMAEEFKDNPEEELTETTEEEEKDMDETD
jgi:hypothetical protein